MPKTYPDSVKEQWFIQLAQGKSPKKIAHEAHCDERTVKRSIQEIRSRRAAQEALTQLYQEAIRGHMNKLNTALDRIINELRLPDPHQTEIAWVDINTSRIPSNPEREIGEEKIRMFGHGDDTFSEGALLAEHLRNGKAWRAFADWKRNREKYRIACGQLQIKIIEILSDTTGLAVQVKVNVTAPFLDAEVAGDLLYRSVIQYLFPKEGALKLERELVIDGEHGVVKHRGIALAEGFRNSQKAAECRTNIVKSLEMLKENDEARQLLNTFQQLEKTLPRVRNELRAIQLLGVLPGQCRLCRQFGL